MGTKNNPGKYDCYANAEPDEPMFVLLGRDVDAPVLVMLWAALRANREGDTEAAREAATCATELLEWVSDRGKAPTTVAEVHRALQTVEAGIRGALVAFRAESN